MIWAASPSRAAAIAEIGGDHLGAHPVLPRQLVGELPQPVLAPRDQGDAVPARASWRAMASPIPRTRR